MEGKKDSALSVRGAAAEALEWIRLELQAAGIEKPFLAPMVGNPIAQVKAPALLNPRFEANGIPVRLVSIEVPVDEFEDIFGAMLAQPDVVASVITVPFKFRAARFCGVLDRPAALAGAANLLTRDAEGQWAGAMTDGDGFVSALRAAGFNPDGCKVYIAGAGGAGSGVAAALVMNGAATIDIFDPDQDKALRLHSALGTQACATPPTELGGYDLLVNATALGLDPDDPMPFDLSTAGRGAFVGDVVAEPEITRLRAAAAAHGLRSIGGLDMLKGQIDALYDGVVKAVNANR